MNLEGYPSLNGYNIPICPFRHFCCRMYRLVAKRTTKKQENASVSFFTTTFIAINLLTVTCWPNFVVSCHA